MPKKLSKKEAEAGYSEEDLLGSVATLVEDPTGVEESSEENVPDRTSPEWSNYVLSKFTKLEMFEGAPTCDGLRRVTQELLGDIVDVHIDLVNPPSSANDYTATVKCMITVAQSSGNILVCSDLAECGRLNTSPEYSVFPAATAATRAESRVLRKMLGLTRIISAEEKKDAIITPLTYEEEDKPIQKQQITLIKQLTTRLKIDTEKFLVINNVANIEKATFKDGARLSKLLNSYISSPDSIPDAIR